MSEVLRRKLRKKLEERQGARLGTDEFSRMRNSRMADEEVSSSSVDDRGPARTIYSFSGINIVHSAAAGPRRVAKSSSEDVAKDEDEDVAKRRKVVAMKKIWIEYVEGEDFSTGGYDFIDYQMSKKFEECCVGRLTRMIETARKHERSDVDARRPVRGGTSFKSRFLQSPAESEAEAGGSEWSLCDENEIQNEDGRASKTPVE